MPENIIRKKILECGADDSVIFVFPSDIAASLWLGEALAITGAGTIPSERFVAWDRFKEEAVQANVSGRTPVSSVLRRLYALNLAERNREAEKPFLSSIIPEGYAETGGVFAAWIARILPQLGIWERKREKAELQTRRHSDAETDDLGFLKRDYGAFLDAHLLFEPSWQRPPLRDAGKKYLVFFPEAIEDYSEYAALIGASPFMETVPVPRPEGDQALTTFGDTRREITALALGIESLLRAGVAPEKIAVSVPDIETVSPYLTREFGLRGIPVEYRSGNALGKLPAGKLFSLIAQTVSSGFSFASVKALLLDRLIPWQRRDLTDALVSFGIRNHCVSSWTENGREIDVWEEAFRAPSKGDVSDWRIADFYRSLSRSMRQLVSANSFTEIRERYFAFREKFLDMGLLDAGDDAVLARCVEELNALASLESKYAGFIPQNPFAFLVSVLDEKKYVPQRTRGGVSVFPYRVAAGTPFEHHYVIDASQDSATVLYSQLDFLRQDKRLALNLLDTDASDAFFAIYQSCGARFSFAERSFKGYRTPHGYFARQESAAPTGDDPFVLEREWFAAGAPCGELARTDSPRATGDNSGASRASGAGSCAVAATADGSGAVTGSCGAPGAARFPDRVHPVQKRGAEAWHATARPRDFSYLESPFGDRLPGLAFRIGARQMSGDDVRTSQTDLALFSQCNARWFLSRILGIEAETSDAELLNERNLGILYHDVLKKLYAYVRDGDGAFNAKHVDAYKAEAARLAETAAADHAEFRGPIAAPLIESLVRKITDGVGGMIDRDAELLDGFMPEFLEDDIAFSAGGIRYYGKIDRISRRESDSMTVLIDYKSGKVPSPSAYRTDGTAGISDFQIPMYVFLAEESDDSPYKNSKIEFAWFGSILEGDYRPVINDNGEISHGRKKGMMTRNEFEPAMTAFHKETETFAASVRARDFTRPAGLPARACFACDFRKICRWTYAVRPR